MVDKASWTQPLPEWWAAVHATYLLGAMETGEALVPLLTALRWADAFDCDWVLEDLPSIFARLGAAAADPLRSIVTDPSAGSGARSAALTSLTAVALATPYLLDGLIEEAARRTADADEDLFLRQTAANLLVDLRSQAHRDLLRAFGREESRRRREDPEYQGVFYDWEVDELLAQEKGDASLEYYRRDWLVFYDPEEIEHRQERWQREQEEAAEREAETPAQPGRDLDAPCPCGSGRAFSECCYLKVH